MYKHNVFVCRSDVKFIYILLDMYLSYCVRRTNAIGIKQLAGHRCPKP